MRLTFLGTAGSWPTKERSASAIALDTEKELVLFDCGEGTQRQFFQSSASFMRVRRVFITHFHGDHFLGLPGLIQSMCLNHRTEPLDLYGPPDAKEMFDQVLKLGYFTLRFPVRSTRSRPGHSVELDGYTVRTAAADHPVPTLAYRLEEGPEAGPVRRRPSPGRSESAAPTSPNSRRGDRFGSATDVVRPDEVMGPPRRAAPSSTPGTPPRRRDDREARRPGEPAHPRGDASAPNWRRRRTSGATPRPGRPPSSPGAAEVQELFLTHFSTRYKELEPLESEARARFAASHAASDLLDHLVRQP